MSKSTPLAAILLALAVYGCGPQGAAPSPPATVASTQAALAPAAPVPGSHEDWCDEHQVPESQCTRCDSSLVAAFKATKDWCEEHGLPESHCLLCNKDLKIVRPAKSAGP